MFHLALFWLYCLAELNSGFAVFSPHFCILIYLTGYFFYFLVQRNTAKTAIQCMGKLKKYFSKRVHSLLMADTELVPTLMDSLQATRDIEQCPSSGSLSLQDLGLPVI